MSTLQEYVEQIENLGMYRRDGEYAPYKPCLLLTIIQLIEQGDIRENKIQLSPNLIDAFNKYTAKFPNWDGKIPNPFYYLKNDGFWYLYPNVNRETQLNERSGRIPSSIRRLQELIAYAYLDEPLFNFLIQSHEREIIRQAIIDKYFRDCRQAIESVIREEQQIGEHRQLLIQFAEHPFSYQVGSEPVEERNPIRGTAFRREIMRWYNYTCAVCRLRVVTEDGKSITDAAHIIPFHISYKDDIRNGISLCKLHHWAFDEGLISVNERYKVRVSKIISEEGPEEQMFRNLRNRKILLPQDRILYPAQEALVWHRENRFRE